MNTTEFSRLFASQYNVSAQTADTWVRSIFEFLCEQLPVNQEIKIAGFGSFRQKYAPARRYQDWVTGKIMTSKPHMDLTFVPCAKLDRSMRDVPIIEEPIKKGGRKSELPVRGSVPHDVEYMDEEIDEAETPEGGQK